VLVAASAAAAPRLPATPAIAAGPRTFAAFAGRPATVRIAWAPVAGAVRYRARWSTGVHPIDLMLRAPVLERTETQAGQHHVTIFAVDELGNESQPAELTLDVVAIAATRAGSDAPEPADSTVFALGARFSSPGLRCRIGGAVLANEAIASSPGAVLVRCGGEAGQPSAEVPVVIVPVIVSAQTAPLRRGTPTNIHVSVASVAPLGDRLEVEAVGDLTLGDIKRTRGGIDVEVTAGDEDGEAGLILRAGSVELGRLRLASIDPPPIVLAPTQHDWFAIDLGGYIGAITTPQFGDDALLLGEPIDPDDTLASGPLAGVRLGIFPTRRVGLELEMGLATPSYVGRLGVAALLITRGQIAARIAEEGRFGLRALVGGGMLALLSENATSRAGSLGSVHYGGAFSVETRRNVSVRLQALHVISVARDAGYAHCLELTIGVVTRLGRRDRWK
jgi:hypothetical protein